MQGSLVTFQVPQVADLMCVVHVADIQANDPEWYQVLTANLTSEQQKALQEVMVLADQRKAAAESKRIEQSGGKYLWIQCSVAEDTGLLGYDSVSVAVWLTVCQWLYS
jgi:hypothetical protein